ncbi:OmpA family protein [Ferrimonas futtsuensis]|uniref:MotY family protein n=1 Tax=Ferrimonas futtsuensis TaxID=364764 RepID=UPI000686C665|nr:OmpA family protein [Ferrimonas futtsuensis]
MTAVVFPALANAAVVKFDTPLERAGWKFDGDKFQCRLIHEVDHFGRFVLSRHAGHSLSLALESDWLPEQGIDARFSLQKPGWQPSSPDAGHHYPAHWQQSQARLVGAGEPFLQALELGWNWQVVLSDSQGQQWQVSSANVQGQPAALAMRQCLKQLLPVSYEQVRRLEIPYPSGAVEPASGAADSIDAAAAYVQADSRIRKVLVDGHSDSDGDSLANLVLSRTRADEIAARLVAAGVPAAKIEIRGHGERFPLVSNGSATGRAKNRRVTIRLVMAGDDLPPSQAEAPDMSSTLPKTLNAQESGE